MFEVFADLRAVDRKEAHLVSGFAVLLSVVMLMVVKSRVVMLRVVRSSALLSVIVIVVAAVLVVAAADLVEAVHHFDLFVVFDVSGCGVDLVVVVASYVHLLVALLGALVARCEAHFLIAVLLQVDDLQECVEVAGVQVDGAAVLHTAVRR